jgi:hypothetical protein
MATGGPMEPEELWKHILSEQRTLIRRAWESLNGEERTSVKRHLRVMSTETGWHPGQRRAAEAALQCINDWEEKGPARSGDRDDH